MALSSTDNERFFAKSIPISVKDVYSNQTRSRHLFLTMEWQASSPTLYSRKVLVLSLTDEEDPFFLYNLHLSDEDFQTLKASQNLLIDFASFSQHMIDYIEKCALEEKNPQPKYSLIFTVSDKLGSAASPSQLDIIENLPFKTLSHLSLKFIAATESAVRQYLTSFFRNLKEENRVLKNKLSFLEQDSTDKLTAFQSRLFGKEQDLELLRKEMSVQLSEKDVQHSLIMQEERNCLIARHKEEVNRHEEERKSKELNFRKQIQQLESRVACLDTLNKELEDRNLKQEFSVREHLSRILTLEKEVKKQKETILSLERKCEKLKLELKEKESGVGHLKGKLLEAEKESKGKAQTIATLKDQIDLSERQVRNLKAEMENMSLQLEVHDRHEKVYEEEKVNLEQIIVKLQGKVEEAKMKCERSARYKTIVEEKEKVLSDLRKETADLNRILDAKNAEMQTLNNKIDFFHQKIDSLEKDLITKQNVIKFLNSELTKNCIIPQFGPPQTHELSPSSVAQKELAKINSAVHRKSMGSSNVPSSLTAANNSSQKSMRIDRSTPSTVKPNSSTPTRFHMTDSAYCTPTSDFTNQATPDNAPFVNEIHGENGDFDPEALSDAFGDRILKHSTAKKSIKPARTITQKPTKKR